MKIKYTGEDAYVRGIGFVEKDKTYPVEKKVGEILLASGNFVNVDAKPSKKKEGE